MSSLQSLVENGECGASNPVIDLARQFTQVNTDSALLNNIDLPTSNHENNVTASSAEDMLQQSNPNISPFNMEALLEQMKQMDSLFEKTLNEENKLTQNNEPLPLISNPPANIEEEFWSEALNAPDFSNISSNLFSESNSINNNWADEYFRQLSSDADPNSLIESKEDIQKQEDLLSFRNQNIDNFDSFFSVDSLNSSNYFKSLPLDLGTTKNSIYTANDNFNLKELVSDQEERLMNMLLSSSGGNVEDATENEKIPSLSDEQVDQMLNFNDKETTQKQTEADFKIPETLTEPQEKFFYENQFDDMEFWMKLAEDWESSKESDLTNTTVNKQVNVYESLDELLKLDHQFHYNFVEENPFVNIDEFASQSDEKQENVLPKTNYIEEGISRLDIGDIPAAILYFEAAAKTDPDNVKAWSLLGLAQAKNENDRKAIAAMKRCLALDHSNLQALMYLGISFTNESMPNEACHALKEWLRQNDKYRHLVEATEIAKLAEPNSGEYSGPTPLSSRLWATPVTGNIFSNGFFDTVRQLYIDAALMSPNEPDPDVQCGLGVLFNLSGEYEKAADCFRTAVAILHTDHTLWNRLGATLANGGKSEEAMFAYREALIRFPGYIRARYNLAISCILLNSPREAVDHLLAVLNLQTAGPKSITSTDSTLQELLSQPNQITSSHIWQTLRSVLISLKRQDLCEVVDERNLDKLNTEFNYQLEPTQNQDS